MEDDKLTPSPEIISPDVTPTDPIITDESGKGDGKTPPDDGKKPNGEDNGKDPKPEQKFTQSEVDAIIQYRLKRANKSFLESYEISSEEEFKEILEKAKQLDSVKTDYESLKEKHKEITESLWFKDNNINPERVDDVHAYFKGKELELTDEALKEALTTHPEWVASNTTEMPTPKTTITKLSPDKNTPAKPSEEDEAAKLFGFNKFIKK